MTEILIIGLIAATVFTALIPREIWTLLVYLVLLGVSGTIAWICFLLYVSSA